MEKEEKIFSCDLNDTNLFNCILDEVGEQNINYLSSSAPIIYDKTYINCINASLVTCLRNNREELDFPEVKLQIIKNESGDWIIKQINILVNKLLGDNLVYDRINQCLKFVKKSCDINDSIQLSIIHSEIKEDLKYFKVKLFEVNQLFKEIRDDKSKKEKLFTIFTSLASNK